MSPETLLQNLEIKTHKDVYYIGSSRRGITIFKQQIRTLNLIYSLQKLNKLGVDSKVGIIGGGIAGITASAVALEIGCKVFLYEKKTSLLHLQSGCKTRWIHPHIYDWPNEIAEFPHAGLPLLSWKEGYAADVVQEILIDYVRITKKYKINYNEYLGAEFKVEFKKKTVSLTNSINHIDKQLETDFDILILATGFGLEEGKAISKQSIIKGNNSSYWRNDDLDQPFVSESKMTKCRVIISGTGDGGLVDLLRSTIKNYHQGRFISDLLNACKDVSTLRECLSKIKSNANSNEGDGELWLSSELENIPSYLLHSIKEYVASQLRQDTEVVLLGKYNSIRQIFSIKNISLFNAFAVYVLYRIGAFTYHGVKGIGISTSRFAKNSKITVDFLERQNRKWKKEFVYDVLIIRHGPLKGFKSRLAELGITNFEFPSEEIDTSVRMWGPGWPTVNGNEERKEFVPPLTSAIAATFIEILGSTLTYLHTTKNPSFRLTLDRFIELNSQSYFQQVCRYAGTSTSRSKHTMGRIFSAKYGIVGYTAKIGEPVLLRKEDDFYSAVDMMGIREFTAIKESLNSMFCIPIFSQLNDTKVVAVLYLDSSEKDFFSDVVIEIIMHSCRGFVQNLETMVKNDEIKIVKSTTSGVFPSPVHDETPAFHSLKIGNAISHGLDKTPIFFESINSFEIY